MKIAVIGAGNLGWAICQRLNEIGQPVHQIISRDPDSRKSISLKLSVKHEGKTASSLLPETDLVFIATPDQIIPEIANEIAKLNRTNTIVVHSSGTAPLSILEESLSKCGVIYPLQTFTKGRLVKFDDVPIFIEGNHAVLPQLKKAASLLSAKTRELDSAKRIQLHLGAVFVNNFTNYLLGAAEEIISDISEIDFKDYGPLILETAEKAISNSPEASQTGPAKRGDRTTLEKHLQLLQGFPELKEIYLHLSQAIRKKHS